MIILSLAFMLQVAGNAPSATLPHVPPSPDTSAGERAVVERLRTNESEFFLTWRRVWEQTFNGIRPVQSRLTAAHCHADGSYPSGPALHVIHPDSGTNLKAWCPIFDIDTTPLRGDARHGIDYMLPLYAENLLQKQRALLIQEFDSAARLLPANMWIGSQRVRLDVDQRMYGEAVAAARDCQGSTAWCSMLTGYALYQAGDVGAADSAFAHGLRNMPFSDRCQWSDISTLLPQPERSMYGRLGCAERLTINDRFWWLANPFMSEPGNERRAEELSREVIVALHSALAADEWIDWRPQYGAVPAKELLLRYGLPAYAAWPDSMENAEHFTWMGFTDSSVNTTAEYTAPRFHTAPPWHAITDPMSLTRDDWNGLAPARIGTKWAWEQWKWPTEFYARDGGALLELDDQTAVLRRDSSALVVVATQLPASFIPEAEASPYVGTLVFSTSPRDTSRAPHRPVDITKTVVLTGRTSIPTIVSAEVMPAGSATGPAGRSRFALTPPPPLTELKTGEIALSDIVLFHPPASDDSLPVSAVGALPRMFGSTRFHAPTKIGVYWEVYGLPSNDTVDVAIRVSPIEVSTLGRRLAGLVGLGHDDRSIQIQWKEPRLARDGLTSYEGRVSVQSRAVLLDVSHLKPGQYMTEVSVTRRGRPPVTSQRSITVE